MVHDFVPYLLENSRARLIFEAANRGLLRSRANVSECSNRQTPPSLLVLLPRNSPINFKCCL